MATFLPPVKRPRGLIMKMVYLFSRRQVGIVISPLSVFAARMPAAFGNFYGKLSRLDKKLKLSSQTAVLIRAQVASINTCQFCMDATRWYSMKKSMDNLDRLDALWEYRSNTLFTDAERAALDYTTELTNNKDVNPESFARLARFYSEREICDIVWLIASEQLYNKTNVGLNIGSDGLCDLRLQRKTKGSKSSLRVSEKRASTTIG